MCCVALNTCALLKKLPLSESMRQVLKISNVRLSPEVRESLKAKLEQIAQQYADQVVVDSHLPLDEHPPISICVRIKIDT